MTEAEKASKPQEDFGRIRNGSRSGSTGLPGGSLVFDRDVFLQRMMDDEELAREVAAGFLTELPTLVHTLAKEIERGDAEAAWKEAHKMKGSAGNVGADALRDAAAAVEEAGKAGERAGLVQWIPELEIQAARLTEALQEYLSGCG